MKRTILASFIWAFAASAALAQVNTVPQVGTVSAVQKVFTYSAVARGLAPAASATDIFCISGSATRTISLKQVLVSGTAGTLVSAPISLVRRASLDTGGTPATGAALPVASGHTTLNNPAASATLVSYTANPTVNDSAPLYFRSGWVTLPTTAAGTSIAPIAWTFGENLAWFSHALNIPKGSTAQQYCLNLNGVSVSSGLLDISITWTEN